MTRGLAAALMILALAPGAAAGKAGAAGATAGARTTAPAASARRAPDSRARRTVLKQVTRIRKADYEGDRPELERLSTKLAPFVDDPAIAAQVRYWRGFAQWRRAINGFNDATDPKELEADLNRAIAEFDKSIEASPAYVESKIGAISCLGNLMYLHRDEPARLQEFAARIGPLLKETRAAAPDNPRLLWVMGPMLWNRPSEPGHGPDEAIANYQKALGLIRARGSAATDPLEPTWGEPELLMNIAWSELNRPEPDVAAAERDARAALEIVPYWHYVRDILLPQILEAKTKRAAADMGWRPAETEPRVADIASISRLDSGRSRPRS